MDRNRIDENEENEDDKQNVIADKKKNQLHNYCTSLMTNIYSEGNDKLITDKKTN